MIRMDVDPFRSCDSGEVTAEAVPLIALDDHKEQY